MKERLTSLLRWSEKYTKADMIYVARGGFWQILGQVLTSAFALALVMVFANYLPKETYGLYRYILSLAGILGIFTLSGMNQAVAQAVSVGNEGALRASVRYQLKWSIPQFLAFCALGGYYLYNGNGSVGISLLVMGVCVPLTLAFNTYGAYLAGKREFGLNSVFGIASTAVYALSMMAIVILNGDVIWLVVVYSLSTLGMTLLFYVMTLRMFNTPLEEAADVLKYGRELTLVDFMAPIVSQIDNIILTHFWGPAQLAIYSLARAIPDRATPFIKNFVSIGLPKFSAKTPAELNKLFYLRIAQGLLVGTLCTLAYVVLAPYLFTYLLPKYLDALFYSQLLSLNFIFGMPNRYVSTLMTSQKMSRRILVNSAVQSIARIVSYIVLGAWGGVLGLVIAQVANSFAGMLINILMWRSLKT